MGLYPGDKLPTLCQATKSDNAEMVIKLLSLHCNPDEKDAKGSTPLMHAAWNGNYEIASLLLEAGANPNITNLKMNTALHFACERGNDHIVELLESYGAIRITNSLGLRPGFKPATEESSKILTACKEGNVDKVIELLEINNADPNERDSNGSTLLMHAITIGSIDLVKVLVTHGAEINAINFRRATPLSFAYEINNKEIIDYLTLLGARLIPVADNPQSV